MTKQLFLDLEDTLITPVINGWNQVDLVNIDKIKNFIQQWQPDSVNIFSFAIWNHHELHNFNTHLRGILEDVLGVRFGLVPTVDDDIMPACSRVKGIQILEFSELSAFFGKGGSFRLFIQDQVNRSATTLERDVVLIDDMVKNEQWSWPDIGVKGSLINVDQF